MKLDRLITYFETSPSIKLFRSSQNAPFIVDFLHRTFKDASRITVPHSELLAALIDYRESIGELYPDVLRDNPDQYLTTWCSGEHRWLRRSADAGHNEPVYQLTSHVEDVLAFLDRALEREVGFVGTESRLRVVIDLLADLVAGATDDPEVRLNHLREARSRLDEEIMRVLAEGVTAAYEPTRVREQFATAVTMLKQLLGDFRAVEERFKDITRNVQERQVEGGHSRGAILAFALDAEDVLKREDQGVSFYEFVRFILSPVQQERLQAMLVELTRLDALAGQPDGLATIRRMVPLLSDEAEKVMRTNQRLSSTLRRLLDSRSVSERHRLAQMIGEIKATASALAAQPLALGDVGLSVDLPVEVRSPFGRVFWSKRLPFVTTDLTEQAENEEERTRLFKSLSSLHHLDWRAMRNRIVDVTKRQAGVSLGDLVRAFPPAAGIIEVLGYLQVAQEDRHLVDPKHTEYVVLRSPTPEHPGLRLRVPLVMFFSPIEDAHGRSESNQSA